MGKLPVHTLEKVGSERGFQINNTAPVQAPTRRSWNSKELGGLEAELSSRDLVG